MIAIVSLDASSYNVPKSTYDQCYIIGSNPEADSAVVERQPLASCSHNLLKSGELSHDRV